MTSPTGIEQMQGYRAAPGHQRGAEGEAAVTDTLATLLAPLSEPVLSSLLVLGLAGAGLIYAIFGRRRSARAIRRAAELNARVVPLRNHRAAPELRAAPDDPAIRLKLLRESLRSPRPSG